MFRPAFSALRKSLSSLFVLAIVLLGCLTTMGQTTGVLREVFYNITGGTVPNLTNAPSFPNNPDEEYVESAFEAPSNFADNYGQRMRALLCPSVTGNYTFWIATDDNSVLYLSTDEDPAHKVQIAYESSWVGVRQYNLHPSQESAPVSLTGGRRYYIEALQKEGGGGDNLAVTWQRPGDAPPANGAAPIPGGYLVPYGLGPPVVTVQPANVSVVEGGSATFAVQVAHKYGIAYQWKRGGVAIANATNSYLAISPVAVTDNGALFSCFLSNIFGSTNSTTARLTVFADTTRPVLVSAVNLGDPHVLNVIFSEPVEAASATAPGNYTIGDGVTVLSAAFGMDTRTITLSTTPMLAHHTYTLTVNNVRDRAATPNTIWPNSQKTFTLEPVPLDISLLRPLPEPIGPSSRHGPIIISEIMYHPPDRSDGKNLEYIELYNSNPWYEDISGYRISGEVDFTFPAGTFLAARSYVAIAASPSDLQSVYGSLPVTGPYTNRLSNGSGTLRLRNREGGILFEVNYSGDPPWPAAADGAGHSLVLVNPSLGEGNPAAWVASSLIGGSPGRPEPASNNAYRSVLINEFLAHTDPPDLDYIELFNYGASAIDLAGCILTDDPATDKFIIPANTLIQPQGFVVFDENQLGFRLDAAGETILFKDPNNLRVLDEVRFAAQENGVSMGRSPDGAAGLYRLETKSPGAANEARRLAPVVINEIMYDPISGDDDDQYVELHNRTTAPVDVGRWSLDEGIKYTIPPGTTIPAAGYLVIARNAARLLSDYSNLTGANTLGNFSGALAHRGERVTLAMPDDLVSTNVAGQVFTNHVHIVVDEVTYGAGGRWGKWAHGGGSSLELVDARGDHRLAPNWADSNETAKSGWTTISYTGVLDNGNGAADSLQIILLGPGECLVDDVEVFVPNGPNLLTNPGFESSLAPWVSQGNHEDSSWENLEGYNSVHSLHVRATDRGDTGANRIRCPLSAALNAGQTATIRAKVRWLAGCPEILFRLHGNWLEATGNILTASNLGTPGSPNSSSRFNAGPAITDVTHSPVLPAAGQPVNVVARVFDPDGLAGLLLKYRLDPNTNLNVITMVNNGAGLYSGVIPGQPAGTMAAFHLQAQDNALPRASSRFPDDAPARECLVRWGEPAQGGYFGTYRLWMTQETLNRWSNREHLSNKPLDCTFIYGSRIIYNIGGEYSGSPWHAPGFNSPIGNVCDYLLTFPADDTLMGEKETTLQWPGNGGGDNSYQREQTAYWIAEQMGLPYCYRRTINLFVNGVRRAEMFEDVQQPNRDMMDEFYPDSPGGDLHKVQIWFEFDDPAVTFSAVGATLGNVTTTGGQKKLPFYRWTFAKRAVQDSANNYTNLFDLVDAANYPGLGSSYRRQLEARVDIDNWLKTYAVEHAVGNNDSFAYGGGQNMYACLPDGDTWKMMIWDIDFAFAAQPATSDMFQGIGRSNGIDLAEPAYLRRYWEILQDLANGPLSAKIYSVLDAKYNAMVANGRTIENPSAIKLHISQRRAYLLNLIATDAAAAFSLDLNPGLTTNRNFISIGGTAPLNIRTITINGVAFPLTWSSISNWTAQVVLAPGTNTLLVRGWDASSNAVTGATITTTLTYTGAADSPQDSLTLNEIMYHPAAPDASFLEVYNRSASTAFDLSGWRLAGVDFVFPGGTVIGPGGYLVVAGHKTAFAAAYGAGIPLAGEFSGKLQNGGETLRLIRPGALQEQDLVVDEVRYDSEPPWPNADGSGSSLQLVDPTQDNNRVANWAAAASLPPSTGPQWRYVISSGTASSSTLYMYLQNAGDAYLDDIKLVAGTVAEAGPNLLVNGDFESAFPGPWVVSDNLASSTISSTVKHTGAASLHMLATSPGYTGASSIYQDLATALTAGAPYTLSFWVLENTNGGTLTLRLSGSGILANVDLSPGQTFPALCTPGKANSVRASLPPLPQAWLNEIVPNDLSGAADRFGHRHPWVEIYNSSPTNLNFSGMFLANNYSNLSQWSFPSGTSMGSGQFLVVWLDGNSAESTALEPHTSFTVPPSAGSLALVGITGGRTNILDYLNYTVPAADRSYGAFPDGSPSQRQVFFYPTPGATNNPASPPLGVVINEWLADNQTTLADPADNDFEDWFELYNPGDVAAALAGFYFGTSLTNETKFRIPNGYTVPPRGYLLVWADDETSQNSTNRPDLHVNFKLSKHGDAIGLFAADGTVIDFVSFGEQAIDLSQGRFPDGDASILTLSQPTPHAANYLQLPNTPPTLTAIPDWTIFEGQLLLFTLSATDSDLPAQQLSYTLDPGAPPGAAINPETGLFSWRPPSEQAPATNSMTVRVTDDGLPPLSSTATFAVRVMPRPKISSIRSYGTNGCALTFVTIPGKTYCLEYKDSLQDASWQQLGPASVAVEETLTLSDTTTPGSQRFYRIVVADY